MCPPPAGRGQLGEHPGLGHPHLRWGEGREGRRGRGGEGREERGGEGVEGREGRGGEGRGGEGGDGDNHECKDNMHVPQVNYEGFHFLSRQPSDWSNIMVYIHVHYMCSSLLAICMLKVCSGQELCVPYSGEKYNFCFTGCSLLPRQ